MNLSNLKPAAGSVKKHDGRRGRGEATGNVAKRGVEFLLRNQNETGTWWEEEFTGTGFPVHFFIKYHMYQHFFPLMALGRYQQALENS